MRRIYFPTKDASLYEEYYWRNTGFDEVLEVGKAESGAFRIRSLLQFDLSTISSSIAAGTIPFSASFDLRLFVARADDLRLDQQIQLNEVSRSWSEGTGYFYQNSSVPYTSSRAPTTGYFENDGVTWKNRQSGSLWSSTGSEFSTSPTLSGTIADPVDDMTFDVSSFVRRVVSGTIPNNGLIAKFPESDELDNTNNGNIKFFSRQTHTVYTPQLVVKWDDQQYITGSISGSSPTEAVVVPKNLRPKYKKNEVVRVDLAVRDRYPVRTFDTVFSAFAGNQRLPSSSYFSIVDNQNNESIIPFDDYSKVSCDGSGSFFNFRVEGMFPGRFYKVMVKVINQGYEQIHDSGHLFTVETI